MPRKKIAIVSSYAEECGAAFYSSRLKAHLERHCDVDVLRLNVWLLRSTNRWLKRSGNNHIADIAKQLSAYDGICMQLEPGLYAASLGLAYKRILTLLKAHHNIVVTVHGFYTLREYGVVRTAVALIKGKFFKTLRQLLHRHYDRITVKFWTRVRSLSHVKLHTFCDGDATYFRHYFGMNDVSSFPITYYSAAEIDVIKKTASKAQILTRYKLDDTKRYIGIFGFLNPYKGHLVALKALEYLPEDYHLLIIGGEHPHGLTKETPVSKYLRVIYAFINGDEALSKESIATMRQPKNIGDQIYTSSNLSDPLYEGLVPTQPLGDRVHFIGQLSDEEMSYLYSAVDYIVHPYIEMESGQSASGPAVLALEFGTRALYSNARVFRQMENYYKGAMPFFGIGNYKELAESILRYDSFENEIAESRTKARTLYNPQTMAAYYLDRLGIESKVTDIRQPRANAA